MQLRIRNQPNFIAGVMFSVLGGGFFLLARGYRLGSAAQMGPGYFPTLVGGLLAVLGVVIVLRSLTLADGEDRLEMPPLRPIVLVLGSITLFAVLLPFMGLLVAGFVLMMVSAFASHEFSWRYALVTAVLATAMSWLIFVKGLGVPMPLLPGAN